MSTVFVALVEVAPLPGCELCSSEEKGGYARCYALAADAEAAERAVVAKLGAERLQVVQVEWCESLDDADWEQPDDEDAAECAREARESGEVVIGRLDTWTDDDGGESA